MHRYGLIEHSGPDGVKRFDCYTCGHCMRVVKLEPKSRSSATDYCRMCQRQICEKCGGTLECRPFEKQIEARERAAALTRG